VSIPSLTTALSNPTEKGLSAQYARYLAAKARKQTAKDDAAGVPEYQRKENQRDFFEDAEILCEECGKCHIAKDGCAITIEDFREAEAAGAL